MRHSLGTSCNFFSSRGCDSEKIQNDSSGSGEGSPSSEIPQCSAATVDLSVSEVHTFKIKQEALAETENSRPLWNPIINAED